MSANRRSPSVTPYVVGFLGTSFIIFLLYLMLFVPKLNEAEALNAQTAAMQTSNDSLKARMDLVQAQKDNLPALQEKVKEFNRSFPAEVGQKEMIDAIARAADETSVEITSLVPSVPGPVEAVAATAGISSDPNAADPTESTAGRGLAAQAAPESGTLIDPVAQVELKIDAQGSDANLRAFLVKLETLNRPVMVKGAEIHQVEGGAMLSVKAHTLFVSPLKDPTVVPAEEPAAEAESANG